MEEYQFNMFHDVFKDLNPLKDKIAILMHKDPDPDSVGAASALKWLIKKKYNIPSRIYYDGDSDHRQLETLFNVLSISLHPLNMSEISESSKIIIVDAVPQNSQVKKADLIIDHHKSESGNTGIIDLVGSCCTIIYELIKMSGYVLSRNTEEEEDLATCLFFGIRTDTNELLSDGTTDRDWDAYQELSASIDRQKAVQIINYAYPAYFRDIERIAMDENNYRENAGWYVCGIGEVSKSRKNTLSMLSEKMVRYEGIKTAIIFGIKDNCLEVSIRSTNNSVEVNKLAKSLFGEQYAGGRRGSAGARVPLGILFPNNITEELSNQVWECLKALVFHKVLQKSKGN